MNTTKGNEQSPVATIPPPDQIRARLRVLQAEADILRKLLRASERLQKARATTPEVPYAK